MARRQQQTLRQQRDALKAKVARARAVGRDLSRQRQQADEAAEQARVDYIAHLAASGDATGRKSGYAARKLDTARARAQSGDWAEKIFAAERLIAAAQGEV